MSTFVSSPDSALNAIREQMKQHEIDALIVGMCDAHNSEYIHESEMRVKFCSNFTGSSATVVIMQNGAYLFTDGRYFLQAEDQLSPSWTLMKLYEPGVPEWKVFLEMSMCENQVVGVDAALISTSDAQALLKLFARKNIQLKALESNPVDAVWTDRPSPPQQPAKCHPLSLAGKSHSQKIASIQEVLLKHVVGALVLTMLDEIAWLFNIRGDDIMYNPVVTSYAVVTTTGSHLFINEAKLTSSVREQLKDVTIHPYEAIDSFLEHQATVGRIQVDAMQVNWKIYRIVQAVVHDAVSPVTLPKALKNEAEMQGIRNCHVRDGAALTAFLHWLELHVKQHPGEFSEYDVGVKIEEFRTKLPNHVSPSFGTIAAYGPNGAHCHYSATESSCSNLGLDSLFLLDSGGQYNDGTTDVTRTVHFGQPTEWMIETFTRVLQGHIALASAVFPEGTSGHRLDCLARLPLFEAGLDFNHGTGHGVGAFLNVHEGPQGISSHIRSLNPVGYYGGMTTSIEPGYYEAGNFGIRIENLYLTVPADTPHKFNGKQYCRFDVLTMTPIKRNLINVSMLTDKELKWVNNYHSRVRELVQPIMVELFPEHVDYLLAETEIITRV